MEVTLQIVLPCNVCRTKNKYTNYPYEKDWTVVIQTTYNFKNDL